MLEKGVPLLTEYEELRKDVEFLKNLVKDLATENRKLKEEVQKQKSIIESLQKQVYGPKTEKAKFIDPAQSSLVDDVQIAKKPDEPAEEEVTVTEHKRKKRKQRGAGKELPIVLEIIDLPENEKIGPDGKPKVQVGFVDTDKIEYTPEKLFIYRTRRLKYRNASDNTGSDDEKTIFSIPALPPQIAPKSYFSPSLLAYLIVSKFLDALPLNRIEKRLARGGYLLSRATMVNGLLNVAKKCEILIDLLLKELKNGVAILMDETPFQVHQEHERKNKTKSYIWVIRGGPPDKPVILFKYHTTREKKVPLLYLGDYKGFLQTDGYDGYIEVGDLPDIIHVLCWAHTRRYYIRAFEQSKKKDNLASEAIEMIRKLFRIEKQLRNLELPPEEFLARRKKEIEPVFESLKKWLQVNENKVNPTSLLGQAIGYTKRHWDKLIKYINCADLTPSTNLVENIIRTAVIGRKNYMFFGSPRGAYAGMTFYSLIETARANGLEPYKYLKYIFTKIPYAKCEEDYKKLLPQYLDQDEFGRFDKEQVPKISAAR